MQRARRLTSVAAIAAAGVLAVAGCRSAPGVAAYVGDHKITEERVTAVVDDAKEKIGDNPQLRPPARSAVVSTLVLNEVCKRVTADKGLAPKSQVTPEQVSQAFGLPETATYTRETAAFYTCLSGLPSGQPAPPTAEELADIVARGKAAGALPPDMTVQQAATQLDGEQLRSALVTRKAIADAVAGYNVTVNPRYRPLEFPILRFKEDVAAVSVPLGEEDSGAVIDRS
jgi:hypothetical protein